MFYLLLVLINYHKQLIALNTRKQPMKSSDGSKWKEEACQEQRENRMKVFGGKHVEAHMDEEVNMRRLNDNRGLLRGFVIYTVALWLLPQMFGYYFRS